MSEALHAATSILFDGLGYAMILFIVSVGLSVTMGLMGVVNLAHGAFAMAGGYAMAVVMTRFGMPFMPALLIVALAALAISIPVERAIYVHVYRRSELQQMLLTIGLTLMIIASITFAFGPSPVSVPIPAFLDSQFVVLGQGFPAYRIFVIVFGFAVFSALWLVFERTILGAKIRAAVDHRAMAEAVGVDTQRLFTLTFAVGTALAAVGGALAVDVLGLTPRFALQYIVLMLVIVSVGGLGTITGPFLAALLIGLIENAGRYFYPAGGAFFIYLVAVAVLLYRPAGLYGRA